MLGSTKKIHFVGIGGIGMSGIAELLLNQGFEITGSDLRESQITRHLSERGIRIHIGHDPSLIGDVDVVVKSSAVKDDNPEIAAAKKVRIPVIRRAEMLAEIMRMSYGIGIAGTHGKTTTTSMVGMVLKAAGLDPTVIVGGRIRNFGSNNLLGSGQYIVVEADEYDRSFLTLTPIVAGITNIEADHLDYFGSLEQIDRAFIEYANKVPFFGSIIACLDDPGVQRVMPRFTKQILTYGLSRQADVRAEKIGKSNFTTSFHVVFRGYTLGTVQMQTIGTHNILNALQAVAIGLHLDIPFPAIAAGLGEFKGVYRRFELKGEAAGVRIYDDYAHHPSEIKATLKGVRENTDRRIVAVFQPHLYSRTRDFREEFGSAFHQADVLVVTPIYPAREKPIPGITSQLITDSAIGHGHRNVHLIESSENIVPTLTALVADGDIVITMGAGTIFHQGEELLEILRKKEGSA